MGPEQPFRREVGEVPGGGYKPVGNSRFPVVPFHFVPNPFAGPTHGHWKDNSGAIERGFSPL
jgi:hypothetical protein